MKKKKTYDYPCAIAAIVVVVVSVISQSSN